MASNQTPSHPFTLRDFLALSGLTHPSNQTTVAPVSVTDRIRHASYGHVNQSSIGTDLTNPTNPGMNNNGGMGSEFPRFQSTAQPIIPPRPYPPVSSTQFHPPQGPDSIYLPNRQGTFIPNPPSCHINDVTTSVTETRFQPSHRVSMSNARTNRPGRPQLRRSNTVGTADVTTAKFTPNQAGATPYRVLSAGGGMAQQPMGRRFGMLHQHADKFTGSPDFTGSHIPPPHPVVVRSNQQQMQQQQPSVVDHWPNPHTVASSTMHPPPQSFGVSPTERVMRRLASTLPMNTGSLDRNAAMYSGVNSNRVGGFDPSQPMRYQYSADSAIPSRGNQVPRSGIDGGYATYTDMAAPTMTGTRRARLRREHTVETGGPVSAQSSVHFLEPLPSRQEQTGLPSDEILTHLVGQTRFGDGEDLRGRDEMPEELGFASERFQGRTLVQWLCRQLVRTGHAWSYNLITLVAQLCTALIRLGVLRVDHSQRPDQQTNSRPILRDGDRFGDVFNSLPNEALFGSQQPDVSVTIPIGRSGERFDLNRFYQWSGQHAGHVLQLLDRSSGSNEAALLNRSNQAGLLELRREYEGELDRLTRDHELQLFRVKNQGVMKVCQLTDRIEWLEQEVEKYRILAGIERLTRSPLMEDSRSIPRTPNDKHNFGYQTTSSPANQQRPGGADDNDDDDDDDDGAGDRSRSTRSFRFGYSVPDSATRTDSPNGAASELRRSRAHSETPGLATIPPIDPSMRNRNLDFSPNRSMNGTRNVLPSTADELPKTKGLLRRLKELGSSSATDSGLSRSSYRSGSGRLDSQDTAQQSLNSTDLEDSLVERSQFMTKGVTDSTRSQAFGNVG